MTQNVLQREAPHLPQMAALVVLLTVAGFGVSLEAPFHWDDYDIILPTRALRSLRSVPDFFRPGYWVSTGSPRLRPYRPVRETYFTLLFNAFGESAAGWHAANLVLHAANALLLYLFIVGLLRSRRVAACAAALFAAHPMHVEAVVWVKNAGELLAFLFAMISGLLFLVCLFEWDLLPARTERSRIVLCALSAFAFVVAICAKESAVVLPAILVLGALFCPRAKRRNAAKFGGALLIFSVVVVTAYGGVQLGRFSDAGVNPAFKASAGRSVSIRFAHSVETVWRYGRLMALPLGSHAWHSPLSRPAGMNRPAMWILTVAGSLILGGALWLSGRSRGFLFGFWWTFLGLAPVANFIAYNAGRPVAEQRVYFPSAGWCLLLGMALTTSRRAGRALLLILVVIFTALSVSGSLSWNDRRQLWVRSIRYSPRVAGALCNLGNIYNDREWRRLAQQHYEAAARYDPGSSQIQNNIGAGLERAGDLDKAIRHYRRALDLKPDYAKARHNLARALIELGRLAEAKKDLDRILKRQPEYVPALLSRADILGRRDRIEEAVTDLRLALKVEPHHVDALYMLGRAYHVQHRHKEALDYYDKAIAVEPDFAPAYAGRGRCLASLGRTRAALASLKKAVQLDPDQIEARRALAQIYSLMNRHAESAAHYRACLDLAVKERMPLPERVNLLRLMARELGYAGLKKKARAAWRRLLRSAPEDPEALEALGPEPEH